MSMKNIDKTLPIMVEVVKLLISQHPDEKGIIHAVNYKVAQYLHYHIKDPRLLIHTTATRDVVMQMHLTSKDPTILLSPSMMEGVDLADEASRFQILCKVPFPYLGDDLIKKRMERNKEWYTYQTVKSVVQAFGRSIRNETDHAISYIIDEDWERFYRMNKKMFPAEFSNALT
jgi:ATP-dependent DNA helicase DinG